MDLATVVAKFKFYPQIIDYTCEAKNACDKDACATKADCSDLTIMEHGETSDGEQQSSSSAMTESVNVMLLAVLLTRLVC